MAQDKNDTYRTDEKSTTETGSDIPGGDGTISDEDMHAISGGKNMMPTSGVGAIQDSSDTSSDIAHIEGENE
jgi:hypothetical protein